MACRERTTPRAVPYPAVAREPVLQMVSTLMDSLPVMPKGERRMGERRMGERRIGERRMGERMI